MDQDVDNRLTTLPEAREMKERLNEISSGRYLQTKLHGSLIGYAGQKKTASGVLLILTQAFAVYCECMPPIVEKQLLMKMERYLKALIVDPKVLERAIQLSRESQYGMQEVEKRVIILPDAEEMQRRLNEVEDRPFFQEYLYPLLLEKSGKEMTASDVANMMKDEIVRITKETPMELKTILPLDIAKEYIAILINDDEQVREEALRIYESFLEFVIKQYSES